jgi:hypothetical protein
VELQGIFPLGLNNIQTLFIDNSASPTVTFVNFPVGGETIAAEPFTRGFYPVTTTSLTMTVSNTALTAFNVDISVYNFIIPPIVTNATGLSLGSGDIVLPVHEATLATSNFITMDTVAATVLSVNGNPFYYIDALNINFYSVPSATAGQWSLQLYDSFTLGATINKLFWTGIFGSSPNGFNGVICDMTGLALYGMGALYAKGTIVSGTVTGTVWLNFYGGTTSALG